jgi:hypothetical protein
MSETAMAARTFGVRAPSPWDWLGIENASVLLLSLALLGGFLTLAAVQAIRIDCHIDQEYLAADDGVLLQADKGTYLVTGREFRRCDILAGGARIPLLSWVQPSRAS